jgi:hypothetical protein
MRPTLLYTVRLIAIFSALLLVPPGVFAFKDRAENFTYIQSGPDGIFYARCVPAGKDGGAGHADIYRVHEDKDELLDRYDLYPRSIVLGWSPIAGKVAVMAIVRGEAADWKQQEEFRFMIGGKLLKKYTSADLLALGADEQTSRPGGQRAAYRVGACEQVPGTNDYDFVVELKDGAKVRFDILTGEPRQAAPAK